MSGLGATDSDGVLGVILNGLRVGLGGLVVWGLVSGTTAAVINGTLALGISLLPAVIERRYHHRLDGRLAVWITVAVTVHAVGSLGPYESQAGLWWWYDKVAHMISSAFIAGIGYALVSSLDQGETRVQLPEAFRVLFTLVFILAVGVTWEIIEFVAGQLASTITGAEVLIQFGIEDTILDLVFNTLAAVLVALWGTEYFSGVTAALNGRLSGPRNP